MTQKRTIIVALAALLAGAATAAVAWFASPQQLPWTATAAQPLWTETAWPFLTDQWGKGKAFRCSAGDCGTEVNLYIRAKIGFCNCTTGVADDPELERLSDFDLVGSDVTALGDGRPIDVAWMKGRSRAYTLPGRNRPGKAALSVAFNDRCDAVVATAVTASDRPVAVEPAVIDFLNSKTVLRWAEVTLGL
jgi:hypothetical protein